MNKTVKFKDWECIVKQCKYGNGRIALQLIDKDTLELVLIATVNLPLENLKNNEIAIKDYSENEGIELALIDAGYIGKSKREVKIGWVSIRIYDLLIK